MARRSRAEKGRAALPQGFPLVRQRRRFPWSRQVCPRAAARGGQCRPQAARGAGCIDRCEAGRAIIEGRPFLAQAIQERVWVRAEGQNQRAIRGPEIGSTGQPQEREHSGAAGARGIDCPRRGAQYMRQRSWPEGRGPAHLGGAPARGGSPCGRAWPAAGRGRQEENEAEEQLLLLRGTDFAHIRRALFVVGEIRVLAKLQHYRAATLSCSGSGSCRRRLTA
jgi:hypothetical protein